MAFEWNGAPEEREGFEPEFDGISSTTSGGGSGSDSLSRESFDDAFDGISSTTSGGGSGSDR